MALTEPSVSLRGGGFRTFLVIVHVGHSAVAQAHICVSTSTWLKAGVTFLTQSSYTLHYHEQGI